MKKKYLFLEEISNYGYTSQSQLARDLFQKEFYGNSIASNRSYLSQIVLGKRPLNKGIKNSIEKLMPGIDLSYFLTSRDDSISENPVDLLFQDYMDRFRIYFLNINTQEKLKLFSKLEELLSEIE